MYLEFVNVYMMERDGKSPWQRLNSVSWSNPMSSLEVTSTSTISGENARKHVKNK